MSTDSLNISLPASLGVFVITEAQQRGFPSPDEYVRSIIEEQQRRSTEQLEALLDESIASGPAIEYTPERWRQKRNEILQKLGITEET